MALLDNERDSGLDSTRAKDRFVKGDHRIIVTCDEIEEIVFGSRFDPEKVYGRRKNRASRAIKSKDDEWKSVDMEDTDEDEERERVALAVANQALGQHVRPTQIESDVNFSVGGERGKAEKLEETSEDLEKRLKGQKQAEERKIVRRAARRAVVFGFEIEGVVDRETSTRPKNGKRKTVKTEGTSQPSRRKCEALMNGSAVEPSYAKGDWSIRWRDE